MTAIDPGRAWIARRTCEDVSAARARAVGPLAGWTVAVKDNVDVAGFATTAGCPSYAYEPTATAPAVQRLLDAGAVVVGKTNLDQFATGLVGTRSPYGAVVNPRAPELVSGGSSSGSAAAVAAGEVDVAVATDTAGSGRVPAAFCGIVGLKGTRGWVPTRGVVPACPSFDCTTVFAPTVHQAATALRAMAGPDPHDPSSRARPAVPPGPVRRLGVPAEHLLADCDPRTRAAFATACDQAAAAGFELVEVDLDAYLEAGALLYGGAFVAERTAAVGDFLGTSPSDADPTVAAIIAGGRAWTAVDLARDQVRLARLRRAADAVWQEVDAVLTPTTPAHPSVAEVEADPVDANGRLGRFVSGCNLVDWCAAVVPAPAEDGLPFGVQLLGPAWSDPSIWRAAAVLAGEDADALPASDEPAASLSLAVCGAHLAGEPLNHQLTERGAVLQRRTTTAAAYRMAVLDGPVPKPGVHRVGTGGASLEVEVWSLDPAAFGSFLAEVPPPLAIGPVELADGSWVPGFLCDALVAQRSPDITAHGGWRAWRAS